MSNQKRRTAWSVQDVASGRSISDAKSSPKFKSGYTGPKKPSSAQYRNQSFDRYDDNRGADRRNGSVGRAGNMGEVHTNVGSGVLDFAWIAYCVVLVVCLTLALIIYSRNVGKIKGYSYPTNVFSINGVLNRIHDDYKQGGLGHSYEKEMSEKPAVDSDALLGSSVVESSLPNTTMGATMALDTGSTYKDYGIALTYSEMLEQLKKALEDNEFGFVGMKLAYEDAESKSLIGYPQSVVEHFTAYMSENEGKREIFLDNISDENKYMVKNGSAFIVRLPILQFTINMGYDNTNVSVSGFSDRKMDAGQSAVVSPLLPCMYTITVTTDEGSQSSEVECDMGEGNLQVNIGVTN